MSRPTATTPTPHRVALALLVAIGAVLRLVRLDHPAHVDERITLHDFVSRSWTVALSDYTIPNNHVFHTLLAKASVAVFGPALWALRLPALVAGLLIVPATYAAVRRLYGRQAALVATALVATSGEMITFAVTARGYSLVTLAFLLLVVVGAQLEERPSRRGWATFAVVAALGMWTIPVMLFPLGAVAGWLALSFARRRDVGALRALASTLAGTAALTVLCYAPVLAHSGLAALVRNEYVVPSSWPAFGAELARTAASTLWFWRQGIPAPLAWALAGCAVVALARHPRVSARPVGLPHAAALWCVALLLAMHRAPPERVWQWLVPLVAGLAGAGLVHATERSPRLVKQLPRRLPALAVALAVVNAAALLALPY